MAFLKNKRKNILENAYIMPHIMREIFLRLFGKYVSRL